MVEGSMGYNEAVKLKTLYMLYDIRIGLHAFLCL